MTMTPYNNIFDTSIQCEESMEVSPEEQAEIFQMLAEEHQAYKASAQWSAALEEKEPVKDWLNGYSNEDDGEFYNGIAV